MAGPLQLLLGGSGSMSGVMAVAKRAARTLLGTLRAGDEAEVVQFNNALYISLRERARTRPPSSKRRTPRSPASCARSTASATCRSTRAPTAPGQRLAVKARLNDRDLILRHRAGYCAPAGDPSFRILPASAR